MRLLAIALTAALLLVTGCSGGDQPNEPDPTAAEPTSEPSPTPTEIPTVVAPADLVVEPGAVGPARAGMSKAEALQTGLFDADVPPPVEGCPPFPLQWKKQYKGVDVIATDGTISSLGVFKDGPKTSNGIGYGSTLDDLTKAYPNLSPVVDAGFNQAGAYEFTDDEFIGFLFGDATVSSIKGSSKVTFIEVTTGNKPDLIRDGC
ncbi:hypothetical protein [Aeromicrobium sp.]|uniref:hypothetical protein n=1 Tax=Aeromicrobium sp. TaxID=1871063 RepID=UPI003D6B0224